MKVSGLLLGLLLVAFCAIEFPALGGPMNRAWDFAKAAVNQPPPGFTFARTGSGRQGNWIITTDEVTPQGRRVLAQIDNDSTSNRFPLAVANDLVVRDFDLFVSCKPVSGRVDQACGVVFRLRDENNYYLARANALEDNVRFYHVSAGKRLQLASWSGRVTSGVWHALRVTVAGDRFEVFWDNNKVIETRDGTFREAGKIGLWTKADSVTYFDELSVASQ